MCLTVLRHILTFFLECQSIEIDILQLLKAPWNLMGQNHFEF